MKRPWLLPLVTALVIGVVGTALPMWLQQDIGVARDETVYMTHGTKYAEWWLDKGGRRELSKASIEGSWGGKEATANNREHPPLMKTAFGFSEMVLHDGMGVGELSAYRFPTALLWGALCALVFAFTWAVWGYAEGLVAAALMLLLPRGLFHAGLAAFDAPIATLWFATIVAYWKLLARSRWAAGAAVAFGCALGTKHNAIILPVVIATHYAWVAWWSRRGEIAAAPRWRKVVELGLALARRQPWVLAMLLGGPVVLLVMWPWLWLDPIGHVGAWIGFHLDHTHYNFEYLGDNWNHPPFPWHVAIVTTLFTVPTVTLAAAGVGAGVLALRPRRGVARAAARAPGRGLLLAGVGAGVLAVRARRGEARDAARAPGLLLLLSLGAAMGPFFLRSTPIFGAEKHWMPALPSIAIAAGIGIVWAAGRVAEVVVAWRGWEGRRALAVRVGALAVLGGLATAAAAREVASAQPYPLTYYTALAGGAPGGADLGMNRQFWGVSARGVTPWLREQPPGPVYTHDADMSWGWYPKLGLLPKGYPHSGHENRGGIEKSQYAMVIHERHFARHDYLIWKAYGTVRPAFVLRAHGVPVVSVYRKPTPGAGAGAGAAAGAAARQPSADPGTVPTPAPASPSVPPGAPPAPP